MSKWPVRTLGAIAEASGGEIRTGPFGSQLHRHDYVDSLDGVPVVMPVNMVNGRVENKSIERVDERKATEMAAHKTRAGDVLLSRRGDIGRYCIIDDSTAGSLCGTGSLRVSIQDSELMPEYLCMFLETSAGLHELQGKAVGSTMPNINASIVKSLKLPVPPLPIQRKITAVLVAYEDLIGNNNRRIRLLEKMAQRIYREWFVDFRYPGHEDVPLVDSELGNIPDGWKVGTIGEVLEVLESGSRPKGGIDPTERGVPSVGAENILGLGRYDFGREKFVSTSFFERMRRGRVVSGDVVLYKDGAYIGRVSLFRDGFPHDECAVNEHVFILRANTHLSQSMMYFWLADPGNRDRVRSLNANSAQPGINQAKLRSLTLVMPPPDLVKWFTDRVEPLLAMLFNLARSLPPLKNARDLLLPRLMSGEIDVSDLDIVMPSEAA